MPHTLTSLLAPWRPRSGAADAAAVQPLVLLVAEEPQRLRVLSTCVQRALPGGRIECFSSCGEALLRATQLPPHFLVIDLPNTAVLAPALRRFLARSAPQATVYWLTSGSTEPDNHLAPERLDSMLAALDDYARAPAAR